MGYSADAPMDRSYRDARINRLFEGTNEINRMLVVDMMLKAAMKGELNLMAPAMAVAKRLCPSRFQYGRRGRPVRGGEESLT